MSCRLPDRVRIVPMLLVMGTIFLLSAQPGDTLHLPPLPGLDKIAHAAIYGLLAATVIFAFRVQYKEKHPGIVVTSTALICLCYGVSDEFHQSFVPGRSADGLDLLADLCGGVLLCLLWVVVQRKQGRNADWREKER